MRILILVLALASFNSFAATSAQCELVDGLYRNSSLPLHELKFETLVDVFTLNNARTMSINLDGNQMKFLRSDMLIGRQTRMIFQMKQYNKVVRVIQIMIDRTPKLVSDEREFYGNMIIFPEGKDINVSQVFNQPKTLVYNFYCQF